MWPCTTKTGLPGIITPGKKTLKTEYSDKIPTL